MWLALHRWRGWGRGEESEQCGRREGACDVQLHLLPCADVAGHSLRHDAADELVQVSEGRGAGGWGTAKWHTADTR